MVAKKSFDFDKIIEKEMNEPKLVSTGENAERTKMERTKTEQTKVSFYIDRNLDMRFDELCLKLKRRGVKTSKSQLIREEIELILNKYGKES